MSHSASTSAAACFSTLPLAEPSEAKYGLDDVSLAAQLYACVAPRLTPHFLRRVDNVASGTFLSLFSFYLIFHLASAWPRIAAALQDGGAL